MSVKQKEKYTVKSRGKRREIEAREAWDLIERNKEENPPAQ